MGRPGCFTVEPLTSACHLVPQGRLGLQGGRRKRLRWGGVAMEPSLQWNVGVCVGGDGGGAGVSLFNLIKVKGEENMEAADLMSK